MNIDTLKTIKEDLKRARKEIGLTSRDISQQWSMLAISMMYRMLVTRSEMGSNPQFKRLLEAMQDQAK